MGREQRTPTPFADELPRLLEERGMSMRALARELGLSPSHLSKIVRRDRYKTPSVELCIRVARAFGLPDDYFPEVRARAVIDRVRVDGEYRDRLYDSLST